MGPPTFRAFVDWLLGNSTDGSSIVIHCDSMTPEEQVIIFLYIVCQASSYRNAADMFHHSLATISLTFHRVLRALLDAYPTIVKMPPPKHSEVKRLSV
ncbi:hypothetical protein VTN31DRAFT_5444 [Thermomyces dupontii]|uniref:uncharacterized protein n=1 Tax=Talaromyces thermophilus TaxID=28565 RepID=UPI0037445F48